MNKAQRELLKTYPDARHVKRLGNDAIWKVTLLDGRTAEIRVHAMAGKLTVCKAAAKLDSEPRTTIPEAAAVLGVPEEKIIEARQLLKEVK